MLDKIQQAGHAQAFRKSHESSIAMPASKPLDTDRQRIERLNAADWQKSHWRKFESEEEEHAERVERAEHEAGGYFQQATVRQKAAYDATMASLRGLMGPRYDRAREAAKAEWARSTVEAADLYQITAEAIMVHGECPEEIAALWDDLDVREHLTRMGEAEVSRELVEPFPGNGVYSA